MNRRQIETELELRRPNTTLVGWLTAQQTAGASLRVIAGRLTELTGLAVSHESIRKWIREG